jgi:hypothetical protein
MKETDYEKIVKDGFKLREKERGEMAPSTEKFSFFKKYMLLWISSHDLLQGM